MSKGNWEVIHSSKRHDWQTPKGLFNRLDREFGFNLDAAASADNTLCERYLTKDEDALGLDPGKWAKLANFGSIWVNPPYGRDVVKWIRRAIRESKEGSRVVVLTFACTETKWFKEAWDAATEVRFIVGRLKFVNPQTKSVGASAPKGSCLLIFEPHSREKIALQRLPVVSLLQLD